MPKLFNVIYRTGGTHNCKWIRVLDAYPIDQAHTIAASIERMGYRTVIHDTDTVRAIGLPIGWDPDSVDWGNDQIFTDRFQTHHIKSRHA